MKLDELECEDEVSEDYMQAGPLDFYSRSNQQSNYIEITSEIDTRNSKSNQHPNSSSNFTKQLSQLERDKMTPETDRNL